MPHLSGKEEAGNRIYPAVTFPNMNDFSAEYLKDLVITQRKTHSEVSLSREWTPPPPSWERNSSTDRNIVGKATLPLCFIFLFIVDKIKVKI